MSAPSIDIRLEIALFRFGATLCFVTSPTSCTYCDAHCLLVHFTSPDLPTKHMCHECYNEETDRARKLALLQLPDSHKHNE